MSPKSEKAIILARPARVLLDCDGVMADFMGAVKPVIRDLIGRDLTDQDMPTWDLFEAPVIKPHAAALRAAVDQPGFCRNFAVLPGAQEGVQALRDLGAEVVCVTSPWPSSRTWAHDRMAWLEEHFGFTTKTVDQSSGKYRIDGDVFVDDHANNVVTWLNWDKRRHHAAVLWAQPYNTKDWAKLTGTHSLRGHNVLRHKSWWRLALFVKRKAYVCP